MPIINGTVIRQALDQDPRPVNRVIDAVAERVGITPEAFKSILRERQPTRAEVSYRIARVLGIPPVSLHPDLMPDLRCARTLRQRRMAAGLLTGEFSSLLMIHQTHLHSCEIGKRNPSAELLARAARFLECRVADIAPPGTPPWTLGELESDPDADPGPVVLLAAS